ncbi:MAG: hypothetical protein QW600_02715 [Candidatus Bathyarchaeia archaeon]|nr:hypothetical protein [Candidatus Bathyarchaeota archaeon]
MNKEMNSRDRKILLILVILLAVAILATISSLVVAGGLSIESQVRRRWGLMEHQMEEIERLIETYRRGEIELSDLRRSILSKFRAWNIIPPPDLIMPDIEIFYTVKSVISTVNVALVAILLFMYIDIYRKTKTQFTMGLIIFSLVLLSYTLSSNPFIQLIFRFRAFGLGPFAMLPDIFTFAALLILLYLSLK